MLVLTVTAEHAGMRVDKAVAELACRAGRPATRADVQRWIGAGRVHVDGRLVTKRAILALGARIEVDPLPPPTSQAEPDAAVRFDVVYEDESLVVVDKPAGLVVHPARGHRGGTLVNGLLARGGFASDTADPKDAQGHLRPGIVHRLDKDTSGLMVVAKDAVTREALKALFATHDIERTYLAIVVGKAVTATYDTTHGRHPKSRLKFTSNLPSDRPGARRACTRVEVVEQLGPGALVRCTLSTGRTHQIRVHLAERAKTPILADPLYGRRPADVGLIRIADELGRQALHAAVLGFVHPILRTHLHWESPLPSDMQAALGALTRLSSGCAPST